ncbi:MAG: hypothetical protein ACI837_001703 [Crocinitomicaceae bacterium]|jgi:hypothetical protein
MNKYESVMNQNAHFVRTKSNAHGEVIKKTIFEISGKKRFTFNYKYKNGQLVYKKVKCEYRLYRGDFYYSNDTIVFMTFDLKTGRKHITGKRHFEKGVSSHVNVKKERLWYDTRWNASAGKSTRPRPTVPTIGSQQIILNNENYCRQYLSLYKGSYTSLEYVYDLKNRISDIIYMNKNYKVARVVFDYNYDGTLNSVKKRKY